MQRRYLQLRKTREAAARRGLTMIEVVVALTVIVLGVSGLLASTVSGTTLGRVHRETFLANCAVRQAIERVQNTPIQDVYATFSAPGSANFRVAGLTTQNADPDGFAGRIEFPWAGAEVREDAVDADWELPMDLNADGAIDAADHAGDYVILPVRVRVDWTGVNGNRSIAVHTFLSAR